MLAGDVEQGGGGLVLTIRVFGRAVGGLEVVHAMENVPVDKNDRPHDDVRMLSVTIE